MTNPLLRLVSLGLLALPATLGCGDEGRPAAAAQEPKKEKEKAQVPPGTVPPTEFGFKSARIKYKHSGPREGSVEAWVDEGGKSVVLVIQMVKPVEKKTILWKDRKTFACEEGKKPWTSPFRSKDTELRLIGTADTKQFEQAGYEKKPGEKIAGKECEVWHQPRQNVTFWRWMGVDLKYVNGVGGGTPQTVEAESVELDVTVPPELLQPPK